MSRPLQGTVRMGGVGIFLLALLAGQSHARAKCYVLLTVDVETRSVGTPNSDIWGILPGEMERHGIERMMDILERHGAKGTFFVNVYESSAREGGYLGEVCQVILRRGHDLQLHTHPHPVFGVWEMSQSDQTTQVQIIEYGRRLIKEWTGGDVLAHRAGGCDANLDTILACKRAAVPMEFSYSMATEDCVLRKTGLTRNAPFVYQGVLCLPIPCYAQAGVANWESLRVLNAETSSPQEVRKVATDLQRHGVRTAVIMLHSFIFMRWGRPNARAERALDEVVQSLVADPNVQVATVREVYEAWPKNPWALSGQDLRQASSATMAPEVWSEKVGRVSGTLAIQD